MTSSIDPCERLGRMDWCEVWRPRVRYAYEASGRRYESPPGAGLNTGASYARTDAELAAAKFPRGATVTAYVNPKDPSQSVLEAGPPPLLRVAFAFVIGVVWAIAWGIVGKFMTAKRPARSSCGARAPDGR